MQARLITGYRAVTLHSMCGVPATIDNIQEFCNDIYGLFQTARVSHLQVPPYRGRRATSYRGGSRATLTLHLPLKSDSSDSWQTTICHDHVAYCGHCPKQLSPRCHASRRSN